MLERDAGGLIFMKIYTPIYLIIVQNLPCPEVSQICSLTFFPSIRIIVVLYAEIVSNLFIKYNLRPNLKNLSRGLNLSHGSNMVGSTKNRIRCFKI